MIAPCLWSDSRALEAADFYVSAFKGGGIGAVTHYPAGSFPDGSPFPVGEALTVRFTIAGREFYLLNGGPYFSYTPAISFIVGCETPDRMRELRDALSAGGRDGAGGAGFADKYGVSWRLVLAGRRDITPRLAFCGDVSGRAGEAARYYCSVFSPSGMRDGAAEGAAAFSLGDADFVAVDGGRRDASAFNEAVSFYVYCRTQAEVDHYWGRLADGGEEGPCGWLKDRFGVSWQIVGDGFEELLADAEPERAARVMAALLTMRKIDLRALRDAYEGVGG